MNPETHAGFTRMMADRMDATIVSVDYRLAPEHPCPAQTEDCVDVYRWLFSEDAKKAGLNGVERVMISGDSAGGGLTFSTQFVLHELKRGEKEENEEEEWKMPHALFPIYPSVNAGTNEEKFESAVLFSHDVWVHHHYRHFFHTKYCEGMTEVPIWIPTPILAPDSFIEALPPTHFLCGDRDPLIDDTVEMFGHIQKVQGRDEGDERNGMSIFKNNSHGFLNLLVLMPKTKKQLKKVLATVNEMFE
eukprot:TRINITY_DN25259_c0_g1_i1.p1 TRINITY_DN25259_c0_g1~~TRINITY_DN25259_c0_g1_i1.p1  ORF type:complete len:246 (-),score=77.79 TRINITY_DN25259_c0_g1_i1:50-787(-)